MSIKFKIGDFSGPLDLLLALVEEEKMQINEVSLAAVTEQFLSYVETLEHKKPEELADFLLVAARLLLLKSRQMLPELNTEDDEQGSLEDQLRLYKAYVAASKEVNRLWLSEKKSMFRIEPLKRREKFEPVKNLSTLLLHENMVKLLQRIAPPKPLPKTYIDKAISVKEKIELIKKMLLSQKKISFFDLMNKAQSRTDVIANFLAILELVKKENIILKQDDHFQDILIKKIK
jgi:segregation and condensation protein A